MGLRCSRIEKRGQKPRFYMSSPDKTQVLIELAVAVFEFLAAAAWARVVAPDGSKALPSSPRAASSGRCAAE